MYMGGMHTTPGAMYDPRRIDDPPGTTRTLSTSEISRSGNVSLSKKLKAASCDSGVAIGDMIFDLRAANDAGLFSGEAATGAEAASGGMLNDVFVAGAGNDRFNGGGGVNVVDLGLVYGIEVKEGVAEVTMTWVSVSPSASSSRRRSVSQSLA